MGPQGLYLNKWNLDFDLNQDIPFVVPVWLGYRIFYFIVGIWSLLKPLKTLWGSTLIGLKEKNNILVLEYVLKWI